MCCRAINRLSAATAWRQPLNLRRFIDTLPDEFHAGLNTITYRLASGNKVATVPNPYQTFDIAQ